MLFYKISCTVKLALLELRGFGLAGQYSTSYQVGVSQVKIYII